MFIASFDWVCFIIFIHFSTHSLALFQDIRLRSCRCTSTRRATASSLVLSITLLESGIDSFGFLSFPHFHTPSDSHQLIASGTFKPDSVCTCCADTRAKSRPLNSTMYGFL
jgi:hypothetical protein